MNKGYHHQTMGIVAMVITASLWSIAGLFIKVIDWNPVIIAGARSFIASFFILAFLRKPKFHLSFPQLAAAVANALTMLLFVAANKKTSAANAILLQYIAPVLTAFMGAALLKEKAHIEHWVSMPFVAAGMMIMFAGKLGSGQFFGDVMALMSAVTFSFYLVFMRMQKEGSPLESNLLSQWIAAGTCLIISMFLPMPQFTQESIAAIFVLGILQIGIPSILIVIAIKRISAVSANFIAVIEPVLNPIWVFLALGEFPGINTVIGGAIILLAVTGASIVNARR